MLRPIAILGFALVVCASTTAGGDVKETKSALESDPKGWIDLLDTGPSTTPKKAIR
jgi:hypothetical protein